jgi:DNA-binding MarR family transcriptional regulator
VTGDPRDPIALIETRLELERAIQRLSCATTRWLRTFAEGETVNATDLSALTQLAIAGTALSPGELSRRLVLTPGGTNGVVRRLIAVRLITRRVSSSDKRDVELVITRAGIDIVARLSHIPLGDLLRDSTPQELARTVGLLDQLSDLLTGEAGRIDEARTTTPVAKPRMPQWG